MKPVALGCAIWKVRGAARNVASEAEDVRGPEDIGRHVGNRGDKAADRAAGDHSAKATGVLKAAAVEGGLGHAADDAGEGETELGTFLVGLTESEERAERHAPGGELSDGASDHDAGVGTGGEQLDDAERKKNLVHAGHDEELPEGGDKDERDDGHKAAGVSEAEHEVAESVTKNTADGGKGAERDGNHHGHGPDRNKDGGEHVGDDLLHKPLNHHEHRHGE